jgi:hypothetical protein
MSQELLGIAAFTAAVSLGVLALYFADKLSCDSLERSLQAGDKHCSRCAYDCSGLQPNAPCPECRSFRRGPEVYNKKHVTIAWISMGCAIVCPVIISAFVATHLNIGFIIFLLIFSLVGCFVPTVAILFRERFWRTRSLVAVATGHAVAVILATCVHFWLLMADPFSFLLLPIVQTLASTLGCFIGALIARLK